MPYQDLSTGLCGWWVGHSELSVVLVNGNPLGQCLVSVSATMATLYVCPLSQFWDNRTHESWLTHSVYWIIQCLLQVNDLWWTLICNNKSFHISCPFFNVYSLAFTLDILVSDHPVLFLPVCGNVDTIYFWFTPKYYTNPSINQN